jgi:hypothetical protein
VPSVLAGIEAKPTMHQVQTVWGPQQSGLSIRILVRNPYFDLV